MAGSLCAMLIICPTVPELKSSRPLPKDVPSDFRISAPGENIPMILLPRLLLKANSNIFHQNPLIKKKAPTRTKSSIRRYRANGIAFWKVYQSRHLNEPTRTKEPGVSRSFGSNLEGFHKNEIPQVKRRQFSWRSLSKMRAYSSFNGNWADIENVPASEPGLTCAVARCCIFQTEIHQIPIFFSKNPHAASNRVACLCKNSQKKCEAEQTGIMCSTNSSF